MKKSKLLILLASLLPVMSYAGSYSVKTFTNESLVDELVPSLSEGASGVTLKSDQLPELREKPMIVLDTLNHSSLDDKLVAMGSTQSREPTIEIENLTLTKKTQPKNQAIEIKAGAKPESMMNVGRLNGQYFDDIERLIARDSGKSYARIAFSGEKGVTLQGASLSAKNTIATPSKSANRNKYDQIIEQMASKYGVSSGLVKAVMHTESSFNHTARSHAGAQGLMQLMPATARRFNVNNSYDPHQNIEGGVKYLSWLIKRFDGDVKLALAGYNAGEGNVDKYKGIPPFKETQNYVRSVLNRYNTLYKNF